jgi:hypothetical protein
MVMMIMMMMTHTRSITFDVHLASEVLLLYIYSSHVPLPTIPGQATTSKPVIIGTTVKPPGGSGNTLYIRVFNNNKRT